MSPCPICGANVDLPVGTEDGEILTCEECGSDLEVVSVDPPKLEAAPEEEEDWGE